jgi:RNA polymerase sigma factor (sigma-70 family)
MSFYEIVGGKSYRELTAEEKGLIQQRQTDLVIAIQDGCLEMIDELVASFKGLVKGMAYRQAERSFTVEQEDFEGLMYEELWRSVLKFDRSLGVPFTPVFIMNVKNAVKMMYRAKSYDLHDSTYETYDQRLGTNDVSPDTDTKLTRVIGKVEFAHMTDHAIVTEQLLTELFGSNSKKKTVIYMHLEGFKRNEIVSATGITERTVNRIVTKFKDSYITLT